MTAPQDNEIMEFFDPKPAGYVLVLRFDSLEAMLQAQENVMASNRRFEEGRRLPDQVETALMARPLLGSHRLFDHFDTLLIAATDDDRLLIESARRDWAAQRSLRESPVPTDFQMSESWRPSAELLDNLEKWDTEAVDEHPAGGDGPRVKTGRVRAGYNCYCRDIGRPDLQLHGSSGGKVLSAFLQSRHRERMAKRDQGSNSYYHGLRRKEGAKQEWFPNLPFAL